MNDMISEACRGLVLQPPDTCPMIDRCLATLKSFNREMRGISRMDEEELRGVLEYIEMDIGNIQYELEEIRGNAEMIRSWGQEWKEYAKGLEGQLTSKGE